VPTLGWILETVEDRFYERGDGTWQLSPPKHVCPICGDDFDDAVAVTWHVNDAHPLERPMLLFAGTSLPSSVIYSVPLDPSAFAFANTTTIRATCNGRIVDPASPENIVERLASERRAVFQIELENSRAEDAAKVSASYTVMTAIPDVSELEAVEELFAQHLVRDRLTTSDVREFADVAARFGSADRYSHGLAQYAYAILAKEGDPATGSTLSPDQAQIRMQQALAELAPHQTRPTARAVCAVARLNINDVRGTYPSGGNPTLDGAFQLLRALASDGVGPPEVPLGAESLPPICPIDRDTHLVLRAFDDLYRRSIDPEAVQGAEYIARAKDATLSAYDRTKLHVMLAFCLLERDETTAAERHLNELAHDAMFGRWATRALESATP
jgi:hypothetical protein